MKVLLWSLLAVWLLGALCYAYLFVRDLDGREVWRNLIASERWYFGLPVVALAGPFYLVMSAVARGLQYVGSWLERRGDLFECWIDGPFSRWLYRLCWGKPQ